MFGKIVDLLIKQDDERRRIIFLFLKLIFTVTIATKLYTSFFGTFVIISITDVKAIVDFFINGKAVICFVLFYFVWLISYVLVFNFLSWFSMWLSKKIYVNLCEIMKDEEEFVNQISNDKAILKRGKWYVNLCETVNIIEIKNDILKPGTNYYKFYDYLLDIEDDKISVNSEEYSDMITLIFQFIVIYQLLDLNFLTSSWWLILIVTIILLILMFFMMIAFVLSTLVDIKHSQLLNLMEKLEPSYKPTIKEDNNVTELTNT
jgi:hypothetical protein